MSLIQCNAILSDEHRDIALRGGRCDLDPLCFIVPSSEALLGLAELLSFRTLVRQFDHLADAERLARQGGEVVGPAEVFDCECCGRVGRSAHLHCVCLGSGGRPAVGLECRVLPQRERDRIMQRDGSFGVRRFRRLYGTVFAFERIRWRTRGC